MSVGTQPSYLDTRTGWLASGDHKRIGMMFAGWTFVAFALGAMLGLFPLIKSLGGRGLEPRFVIETVTYHRLFLVFLFLIPSIPLSLGYFLLPIQLGARNMVAPILSRASLVAYVAGMLVLVVSLFGGPVASDWAFSAPMVLSDAGMVDLVAIGLLLVGASWLLTGINFIFTVHLSRTSDMDLFEMPILSWAMYLSGYMLVVTGAVMCVLMAFMGMGRMFGTGLYLTQPDLWNRLFWLVTTPAAGFALVPAVGVVFEIIAGISRRSVVAYRTVVASMIAVMGLSFLAWGLHLTASDVHSGLIISALGIVMAIPVALLAYSLLATMNQGAIAGDGPDTFVMGFLLHAAIACLMALILASPALGDYLGATMYATAQLDYLIWGGVLFAFLAGLHYWWPKMTGRVYDTEVARIGGVLAIIGLNMALVARMIMGTQGVGLDLMTVSGDVSGLAEFSSFGWLILHSGILVAVGNLLASTWSGPAAVANHWGAATLEWQIPSPPPAENFVNPPVVKELYHN